MAIEPVGKAKTKNYNQQGQFVGCRQEGEKSTGQAAKEGKKKEKPKKR